MICSLFPVYRYSAIRCADAVPMSSAELQQGREINHTPPPEPEHKKSGMNGETNGTSKSSSKPQKGIMGMFANKTAPKSTNSDKDIKPEQKEEAPVVRLRILWFDLHRIKQVIALDFTAGFVVVGRCHQK